MFIVCDETRVESQAVLSEFDMLGLKIVFGNVEEISLSVQLRKLTPIKLLNSSELHVCRRLL